MQFRWSILKKMNLLYRFLQGQFRGRPEIAPDQREKFLQRLQQVQLPSQNSLPSMSQFSSVTQKQLPMQQQNSLLQQVLSSVFSVLPTSRRCSIF